MSSRQYPPRPVVGVGGVILMDDGRVVLVKRKFEPAAGTWTLPGGAIELGETARDAVAREVLEETGLVVDVGTVVDAVDRIFPDASGRIEYHYVIIDYICHARGGTVMAGSDVDEVALADPTALDAFQLTEAARTVIASALLLH